MKGVAVRVFFVLGVVRIFFRLGVVRVFFHWGSSVYLLDYGVTGDDDNGYDVYRSMYINKIPAAPGAGGRAGSAVRRSTRLGPTQLNSARLDSTQLARYPKVRSASVGGDVDAHIVGMVKGAGMIEPNMATMLGFIFTDLDVPRDIVERVGGGSSTGGSMGGYVRSHRGLVLSVQALAEMFLPHAWLCPASR